MSLSEIGREFGISKQAVACRLKNNFKQIYLAYYSKEGEASRWQGGLNKQDQNGGLTDMERNTATEIREFVQNFNRKMDEYEALGGSPQKAAAFRTEVSHHADNFLQRLAADPADGLSASA